MYPTYDKYGNLRGGEREAQDFALAIWQSGGHVDRETNRDSWFVCRVREIVSELYRTRGTAPRQV